MVVLISKCGVMTSLQEPAISETLYITILPYMHMRGTRENKVGHGSLTPSALSPMGSRGFV